MRDTHSRGTGHAAQFCPQAHSLAVITQFSGLGTPGLLVIAEAQTPFHVIETCPHSGMPRSRLLVLHAAPEAPRRGGSGIPACPLSCVPTLPGDGREDRLGGGGPACLLTSPLLTGRSRLMRSRSAGLQTDPSHPNLQKE